MQQRKNVIFIADSLDNAHKFQAVLSSLDVDVAAGSSMQFKKLLADNPSYDLVIYEATAESAQTLIAVEQALIDDGGVPMLIIVKEDMLSGFRLPVQINCDFVVHGASSEECSLRIRQLLWPGNESSTNDFISVDGMTINLATYQVAVNGEPIDFTYLEYALLAFLVTHPGRTYSRDALLRRVWGFDYFGGSRTVDVHVRRVRAKLGPELSQHLETVRGVGYLWVSRLHRHVTGMAIKQKSGNVAFGSRHCGASFFGGLPFCFADLLRFGDQFVPETKNRVVLGNFFAIADSLLSLQSGNKPLCSHFCCILGPQFVIGAPSSP